MNVGDMTSENSFFSYKSSKAVITNWINISFGENQCENNWFLF